MSPRISVVSGARGSSGFRGWIWGRVSFRATGVGAVCAKQKPATAPNTGINLSTETISASSGRLLLTIYPQEAKWLAKRRSGGVYRKTSFRRPNHPFFSSFLDGAGVLRAGSIDAAEPGLESGKPRASESFPFPSNRGIEARV